MPTILIFLRLTLTRRRVPTKRVQMPMSDTSMMHACTMYHVEGRGGRVACLSTVFGLWSLSLRIVYSLHDDPDADRFS